MSDGAHILDCLTRAGFPVPLDAVPIPSFWRHQIPHLTKADVAVALTRDASPDSLRILRGVLPGVDIRAGLGAPRPVVATYNENLKRIHVLAPRNPHREGTYLHEHWRIYREDMPVGVFKRMGGNRRLMEGDIRRGLIKVA